MAMRVIQSVSQSVSANVSRATLAPSLREAQATKQSVLAWLRGISGLLGAYRTLHVIARSPCDEASSFFARCTKAGLLRCARNDGEGAMRSAQRQRPPA